MGSAKNYGDKTARQLRLILPRKSAFAALRSDKPPSKLKCEQRLRFCKVHLKECTFVLDPASFHYAVTSRRGGAAKASRFAAILLASKTKAHVEVETQAVFYVVLVV